MKIVFLNPSSNFARFRKRSNAIQNLGIKTQVLAFDRTDYPGKNEYLYNSLGQIKHGNYYQRIIAFIKAIFDISSFCKNADVIYTFLNPRIRYM